MSLNVLDESSPRIKQPELLKINLKAHQLALVNALRQVEKTGVITVDYDAIAKAELAWNIPYVDKNRNRYGVDQDMFPLPVQEPIPIPIMQPIILDAQGFPLPPQQVPLVMPPPIRRGPVGMRELRRERAREAHRKVVEQIQEAEKNADDIYKAQEAEREIRKQERIAEAIEKFKKKMPNFTNDENNDLEFKLFLKTRSIILGPRLGSGKSYTILGLLSLNKSPAAHNRIIQGNDYFSLEMENKSKPINCNLLVVPHVLLNQWIAFCKKTKLKKYYVNGVKDLEPFYEAIPLETQEERMNVPQDEILYEKREYFHIKIKKKKFDKLLNQCDILVLNFMRYNLFRIIFRQVYWKRVIVDEAHTLKLTDFREFGAFNIFITATPYEILNVSKKRYVSQLFGTDMTIFPYFIITATDEFVDQSMLVPKAHVYFLEARLPIVLQQFGQHIPQDAMMMINAGNYREAIAKLNCDVDTNENIFDILKKKTKDQIHNLKLDKQNLMNRRMDEEEKDEQIKKIEEQIGNAVDKLADLKKRMDEISESCCIICLEEIKAACLTNCCHQLYCLPCLTHCANDRQKCPNCQKKMGLKDFKVIDNEKKNNKKKKEIVTGEFIEMDKPEILEKLLKFIAKENESPKILIFSDYSETFDKLLEMIARVNLTCKTIEGTPSHIDNVVNEYKKGDINILLLNSKKFGAGLNLEMTDYVILYHRVDKYNEEQVIARAQRWGRKKPLKMFYLINSNESKQTHLRKTSIKLLGTSDFKKIKDDVPDSDNEDDEPKKKAKKGKKDDDSSEEEDDEPPKKKIKGKRN